MLSKSQRSFFIWLIMSFKVNESYSEKVLAYSETQEEHFEEREIIAELRKSNPQLSSTNLLSGTSNLISASSSSSASSHTNSNRSSQISTSLKSVDQRQITIANDKQPRNDQQTSSKTKHQPLSFSSVSSSSSSSYDTASRENGKIIHVFITQSYLSIYWGHKITNSN